MKKSWVMGLAVAIILIVGVLLTFKTCAKIFKDEKEKKALENATIIVNLKDDLSVAFDTKAKISDFIVDLNGKIVEDKLVDTTKLGDKELFFEYINDEGIKIPYSFTVNVKDVVAPILSLGDSYTVDTKFEGTLEEKILCADDHDDEPICKVVGEYDLKKVGSYKLQFVAEDASGNKTVKPFTLTVKKPSSSNSNYNPSKIPFSDAVSKYKSFTASLGIDVSSWQGDIDFDKVKNAGVEFAFVRVGSKWGMDGEYFLDSKFERNMEGFNKVGIPVGAYFYSYARNEEEAREEALYVIEHLKKYKVDLPVAFDFEDWSRYNKYKMSLHRLNRNAEVFIETLKEAGYEGMLYGSLNYLNRMWKTEDKTVWVAHYTNNANYEGKYKFWQFTSAGGVDGINGYVDLDIMYK